jgi:hypothetical protein
MASIPTEIRTEHQSKALSLNSIRSACAYVHAEILINVDFV